MCSTTLRPSDNAPSARDTAAPPPSAASAASAASTAIRTNPASSARRICRSVVAETLPDTTAIGPAAPTASKRSASRSSPAARHAAASAYSTPDDPTTNRLPRAASRITCRPASRWLAASATSSSTASAPPAAASTLASAPAPSSATWSTPASRAPVCAPVRAPICAARCTSRSASAIGVTGCRLITGCRSIRYTRPSSAPANKVPNTVHRRSSGAPTTIGTHPPPHTRRPISIARPIDPTAGDESNVEHTL